MTAPDTRAPLGTAPASGAFAGAIRSLSDRFAAEAAQLDPDHPIDSDAWPTVGAMVDHLGQIQRWATEVVRTGASVDRAPRCMLRSGRRTPISIALAQSWHSPPLDAVWCLDGLPSLAASIRGAVTAVVLSLSPLCSLSHTV